MTLTAQRDGDAWLIVDLQPDFMPGGALPVPGGESIVAPTAALLERGLFDVVVATQDWHPPGHISFASHHGREPFDTITVHGHPQVLWPDHCVQGTKNAELHPGLPQNRLHAIIRKGMDPQVDSYSGIRNNWGPDQKRRPTGLEGYLKSLGKTRLFLSGLALDVCVTWTALDAADAGFDVVLLEDLTKPVETKNRGHSLDKLRESGVSIINTAMLGPTRSGPKRGRE